MPTLIENIEFYHEIRNFDTGATNRTSVLKANAGEKVQANIQFRVQIESIANPGNGDVFTVSTISGTTKRLVANSADFIAAGITKGDTFDLLDNVGATTFTGAVALLVNGNLIEFDDTASAIPDTDYTDAVVKLATELDQLIFQYNFTDLSNQTDLVQQLLQSIQLFEYNGLTDLNFHTGVARQPVRGNTGSSQAKRRIATANNVQFFEIEHDFIVLPAGREDQLSNLQTNNIPDPYRNETVFYKTVIEMGVGGDNARLRPLPLDRVANDSVGWRNENFDGGANVFTTDSFSYSIPSLPNRKFISIEAKATTRILATISTTGTFTATHPFVMHFSYLPEINVLQSTSDDYQTATIFDSLRNTIDGGAVSGGVIKNLTGVLNAGDLDIQFETEFTIDQLTRIFDDGAYELYISLADNLLTAELSNRVALTIDAARLTKNPDITGLVENETMEFYDHVTDFVDGVTTGNTSIETWIEEGFMLDGSFDIKVEAELVDIEELFIELIAKNTITDKLFVIKSYTIPTITQTVKTELLTPFEQIQVLALDDTQGFLLKAGDQNNFLKISNGNLAFGNQNYGYQIGLKISWQDWEKLNTVDGSFFDTNELNNGLNKKADRFSGENDFVIRIRQVLRVRKGGIITTYNTTSPEIRVFDYEKDRNVTPDFTGTTVLTDENNNGLGDNLVQLEDSTVTVTYDDGNVKTLALFEAITRLQVKVQGTDDSIHEISSLRGALSGDILKPIAGETQLQKTIVSGNYTTKCLIDGAQLLDSDYSISSELFEMAVSTYISTQSLIFDGANEYMTFVFDTNFRMNVGVSRSFSCWFKTTSVSAGVLISNLKTDIFEGFLINVDALGKVVAQIRNGSFVFAAVRTTSTFNDGNWHHVVVTHNGATDVSGFTIYVDDSVQATTTDSNNLVSGYPGTNNNNMGRHPGFLFHYDGQIDDVKFFKKVLSAANVTTEFNGGKPGSTANHDADIVIWLENGEGDTIASITDQIGSNDGLPVNMEPGDILNDAPP